MRPASITHAVVLAAGYGRRMRPLTDTCPKPLVKLAGRALIDHMLDRLQAFGVRQAIVNVHYLADAIEAHLAERHAPHIRISDERAQVLDTGGALVKMRPLLEGRSFFACNADSVWTGDEDNKNLDRMARAFQPQTMDALLLLAARDDALFMDGAGDFFIGEDGSLTRRAESECAPFFYAGVQIASPALLADAPGGAFSCNMLWDKAMARGRLYGVRLEGTWLHVGTAGDVPHAQSIMEKTSQPTGGRTP